LHVGRALIEKHGWHDQYPHWGEQSPDAATTAAREAEHDLEQRVSEYIRDLPFLWVDVDGEPGPECDRAEIEANCIAMVSHHRRSAGPSDLDWLGYHSPKEAVYQSGLWNVRHVADEFDPRVVDLLETPALARLYVHILQHGPVTVSEALGVLDVPQGTVYDYVRHLETAGLVEKSRDQRPYEYDAKSIALTLSTDGEIQTITPAPIAAVARPDEDGGTIRERTYVIGSKENFGTALVPDDDGYVLAGGVLEVRYGGLPWLARLDANGDVEWTRLIAVRGGRPELLTVRPAAHLPPESEAKLTRLVETGDGVALFLTAGDRSWLGLLE
jgi:Predicted transcriptional regulators